jgi:hypothetical protein
MEVSVKRLYIGFAILVLVLLALGCANSASGGGGDGTYIVRASLTQDPGKTSPYGLNDSCVGLYTSKYHSYPDATVSLFGNSLSFDGLHEQYENASWSPSSVSPGASVNLSVSQGGNTITGSTTMPSLLSNLRSSDAGGNHAVGTAFSVLWDHSPGGTNPAQKVYVESAVRDSSNKYTYWSTTVDFIDGSVTIPASLFPAAGATVYVWVYPYNEAADLGPSVSLDSFLRAEQKQTMTPIMTY